jgi:gamma-glutamyltranspeptidase/glutathione hydrolase
MNLLFRFAFFSLLFFCANALAQIDRVTGKAFATHKKFGKLPMKQVLQPAITYATEGFPVSELIAYYWDRSVPILKSQPGAFLQTFTMDGRAPAKGEIFRNPPLARTLQLLADQGRDVFYKGEIADQIDKFFGANGGYLRKVDFEKHTSTWVDPISTNYRGYDVFELPPNGQGLAALQMLNILEGFDARDGLQQSASAARNDRSEKARV